MYTKTLQNTFFKVNFKGTFPTTPTEGVCNEMFTTKETCPPPPPTLNCVYCFTGFIGRGTDFTCMPVFISKSCQKS